MSAYNKTTGIRRILLAVGYSRDGLVAAVKEAAVRQLLILHVPLVILALAL